MQPVVVWGPPEHGARDPHTPFWDLSRPLCAILFLLPVGVPRAPMCFIIFLQLLPSRLVFGRLGGLFSFRLPGVDAWGFVHERASILSLRCERSVADWLPLPRASL
eukprot:6118451-Heterocapsa_arctica.AAC.1